MVSLVALLLLMNASVMKAGIANRRASDDDVDTNVANNGQNNGAADGPDNNPGQVASIVNVVLPQQSRTCRRCICMIIDDCPTPPERTCLSAASLCCCCASRPFACRGRDGVLQPDAEFVDSFNEIAIGGD